MLACRIVKESVDGVYVNVNYEYIVTWPPDAALSWFRQRLAPACDSPPLRAPGKLVHVRAGCYRCCASVNGVYSKLLFPEHLTVSAHYLFGRIYVEVTLAAMVNHFR